MFVFDKNPANPYLYGVSVTSIVFAVFAWIAVIVRFYLRLHYNRQMYTDDWTILAAVVSFSLFLLNLIE